ncbi:phage protein [Clostridium hydrogeniformans]|uniref:phage protein n=1 Tax=Clostridium hydrogeniformans TaxID=349933 RepID=UPI000488BD46|nr:glucosaminidase domain-containing protein [Clostridium hydrogeniformans]
MSKDFINKIVPGAKKTFEKYGVFPSITIAQAILESGWGKSKLSKTDNNLFGIKFPGAHDPSLRISRGTWATDDGGYYVHYQSWGDSIIDHGYFLKNNERYTRHGVFRAKTPLEQITAIKAAGYAGNPNYVKEVTSVMNDNNLTQYDSGTYTGGESGESANNQPGMTVESTNYQVIKGSEKEGDILFGRRYRITVSDSKGNAIDVSQLHCTFNITKTIQMEPNTSEITIYNLNAQTENTIMISGVRVTIEAGYEGIQFGLIFDGDILQTIREKEGSTTYKLTIIALDSDRAINFDIANFSITRGQTARSMVDHIVSKAQNPISLGSISNQLSGQTLTRGKVFFGKSSDYLRQIAKSNNMQYYMDNGTLNLINMDDLPEGEIFELSPKSGLIGTPEQTDYGISGQCLLNPQIKLNSLIHVDNSLVRAKRIDLNGSNSVPGVGGTTSNSVRDKIIAEAKQICDDPNVEYSQPYRGQTINGIKYYDCSLFVKHCYEVAGLEMVDITYPQYKLVASSGKFIPQSEALPGDIVFWGKGDACHHVAIYAGDGYCYAARGRDGKAPKDQVAYHALYGVTEFGRPKCMIDVDKGILPSANSSNNTNSDVPQVLFRSLDKDGIYRVIKLEYSGDTRGNDWYVKFETIDQLGGMIPAVAR